MRPHPDAHPDGQQDSQRVAEQGYPFLPQQVVQGELDADGEHQEDDPDFREELEGVYVGDGGTGREGTDEDAAQDVAKNQRLAGRPRQRAAQDGGDEDVGEVAKENRLGGHGEQIAVRIIFTSPAPS